ncbi:MAG: glycosyltransferase family 4 protein [Candidatus Nealsonbacteria bacterium]
MKILILTNHLRGSDGWSKVSLDLTNELLSLGCEVLCLTSKKSSQNRIKEFPVLKEPQKYLVNPLVSFLTAFGVKKEIKKFSPDIIHFMVEPYCSLLPFLGVKKEKTFLTVHGTYSVIPNLFNNFLKKAISKYLSRKYYKKIGKVVAVSNYTKDYLLKHYPALKHKIRVITNGVNLEKSKIVDLERKPENKIKKILFVGSVKQRKGVSEVIKALKYYYDNISKDFIYNIVGDYSRNEDYFKELSEKIKEFGLENNVSFEGKLTDEKLEEFYLNADLFLMPSLNINNNFEGFGLVFLEANAKGVPGIGAKNSGLQEAIQDGKTGYIVDPFDFKEMAQKINLILNKKTINRKDCISWAKQNDIKIKARELFNLYSNDLQN